MLISFVLVGGSPRAEYVFVVLSLLSAKRVPIFSFIPEVFQRIAELYSVFMRVKVCLRY
jgi:hypothetical protein